MNKIKLSPYQVRQCSSEVKKKELAQGILLDRLIEPIVVRPVNGHYETIAGGRRVEAILKAVVHLGTSSGLSGLGISIISPNS